LSFADFTPSVGLLKSQLNDLKRDLDDIKWRIEDWAMLCDKWWFFDARLRYSFEDVKIIKQILGNFPGYLSNFTFALGLINGKSIEGLPAKLQQKVSENRKNQKARTKRSVKRRKKSRRVLNKWSMSSN
jgi:hypothetical protein